MTHNLHDIANVNRCVHYIFFVRDPRYRFIVWVENEFAPMRTGATGTKLEEICALVHFGQHIYDIRVEILGEILVVGQFLGCLDRGGVAAAFFGKETRHHCGLAEHKSNFQKTKTKR